MAKEAPSPGGERPERVASLLQAHSAGDTRAMARLTPLVYDELREVAHRQLRDERGGHTLRTTALVHEAFIRLVGIDRMRISDRAHFFALAGHLMRQILIDYARRHGRLKRGGGASRVPLDDTRDRPADGAEGLGLEELIDLDAALTKLAAFSERGVRVVECRFFAGMGIEETAEALGVSPATIKREWQVTRAWLHREIRGSGGRPGRP